MNIVNAKIQSVKVCFDDSRRLSAEMKFVSQNGTCGWSFVLSNPVDVQRLSKLMNYTGAEEVKDLNGKIIRRLDADGFMCGFGHPIENVFVPISTKEFSEISESEVGTLLAKK